MSVVEKQPLFTASGGPAGGDAPPVYAVRVFTLTAPLLIRQQNHEGGLEGGRGATRTHAHTVATRTD